MTPLAQALSTALLHFVWQGIVGGVLLWMVLFFLRKNSANMRYAVNCSALAVLAVAPVVTTLWLYSPTAPVQLSAGASLGSRTIEVVATSAAGPSPWASWYASIETWALPAWALGVLLFALRLAWSCGHASALRREGAPAEPWILSLVEAASERVGVRRRLGVLMSSIAEVPSVVGWIRPVILLPASAITGLTPQQLEAVLAHELAHIRRHDYLVNLLQSLVETLLFYHPVVWWTSANIRRERELCCDDLAVRCCGDAVCYARALTTLEKLRIWKPGLAMNSARGPLFGRIRRVLTGQEGEHGPSRVVCALGLLAGMICLGLHMSWAQAPQEGTRIDPAEGLRMILPPPTAPVTIVPPEWFVLPVPAVQAQPVSVAPLPPLPPEPPQQTVPAPLPTAAPLPPTPPTPWPGFVSWQTGLEAYYSVLQNNEMPWALFRGNREILNGSAEDQAEARAARAAAGGGDLLWFRLDGKAYMSTDSETMARIEAQREPAQELVDRQRRALLDAQNALAEQQKANAQREANVRSELPDLQADIARLQASAQALRSDSLPQDLSRLQAEIMQLQSRITRSQIDENTLQAQQAQRRASLAREEAALARYQAELARRTQAELGDLLRDAVSSGKAKPLQ